MRSTAAPSSFRPEPCGARRAHLVISTGAGRSTAEWRNLVPVERPPRHFDRSRASARRPPSSFRPEPCAARRSGETSSPWGWEVSPLRACGAPVEMTEGGTRLRRCGRSDGGVAGAGYDDTTGVRHGGPTLVISTGAARQQAGGEKNRPHGVGVRGPPLCSCGRSRASARRSGETSSPWGRKVSPLRACGAPVEMTGRGGGALRPRSRSPPAGRRRCRAAWRGPRRPRR